MVVLKNWAVCIRGNEWLAPEQWTSYLHGNVYGHPRFNDGDPIDTSRIVSIKEGDGCKLVSTRNTDYALYEADVSSDYESKYPDAYSRLSLTHA